MSREKTPKVYRSVGKTISRNLPLLAGGIGVDLLATKIVAGTGNGIEVGFASGLIMYTTGDINPLSPSILAFHGIEMSVTTAVAYGLAKMCTTRRGKVWEVNTIMLGMAGFHALMGVNNLWDLAYVNGKLPIPGPLDGFVNLSLTALVNFLDWGWPEQPAK